MKSAEEIKAYVKQELSNAIFTTKAIECNGKHPNANRNSLWRESGARWLAERILNYIDNNDEEG